MFPYRFVCFFLGHIKVGGKSVARHRSADAVPCAVRRNGEVRTDLCHAETATDPGEKFALRQQRGKVLQAEAVP